MSKNFLAVVEFPSLVGDPIDNSHNQFAWTFPDGTPTADAADAMRTALDDFYNNAAGTHPIAYYMSTIIDRGADRCPIRLYDITGHENGSTPIGSPVALRTMTLGPAVAETQNMPNGVSVAISFHSAYGSDVEFGPGRTTRPRARDRGRVYIGPMNWFIDDFAGDNRAYIDAGDRANFVAQASRMSSTLYGTIPFQGQWCVWSRRAAALKPVVGGWVDDRFDYQRRREDQGIVRTTW